MLHCLLMESLRSIYKWLLQSADVQAYQYAGLICHRVFFLVPRSSFFDKTVSHQCVGGLPRKKFCDRYDIFFEAVLTVTHNICSYGEIR